MIVEGVVDFFLNLLVQLFSTVQIIGLPFDALTVLANFLGYGCWIVGLDTLALFTATIVFWWVFHMSIGLILWVYEKLPFT